jgi:hypothetical protein
MTAQTSLTRTKTSFHFVLIWEVPSNGLHWMAGVFLAE